MKTLNEKINNRIDVYRFKLSGFEFVETTNLKSAVRMLKQNGVTFSVSRYTDTSGKFSRKN